MLDHIFRRYDIRGQVNIDFFLHDVEQFSRALSYYLRHHYCHVRSILLCRDGRIHSQEIEAILKDILREQGFDVITAGICPTPVLYFGMYTQIADAGIMITASHNGPSYNGFKLCVGTKGIWGEELQKLRLLCRTKIAQTTFMRGTVKNSSIKHHYSAFLADHFAHLKLFDASVIMDCGNGTAGVILPELAALLQWPNIHFLHTAIDGTFAAHEADPTVFENMQDVYRALITKNYSLGIGFDGDADRMLPMTTEGELVAGDIILALFAHSVLLKNPGAAVVYDMKCSNALEEYIVQEGGRPIRTATGHALIKEALEKEEALLAGELSGHFYFKDRFFGFDDGIYAALRLLEVLLLSGQTLSELRKKLPQTYVTPELRIPCKEEDKKLIMEQVLGFFSALKGVTLQDFEGMHITFPCGWAIIRPSHTQPVICVRGEALSSENLEKVKMELYTALYPFFGALLQSYLFKEI